MIKKSGKRKIEYEGKMFYWHVRISEAGKPKIFIISEDKKIKLEYPAFDSEMPVTPSYVLHLLEIALTEKKQDQTGI